MWQSWVKNTEWGSFLDLVSPSFFDVLPMTSLISQVRELMKNSSQADAFLEQRHALEPYLAQPSLRLPLVDRVRPLPLASDERVRRDEGQRLLTLYFAQLLHRPAAILDLRPDRFGTSADREWAWAPRPLWVSWDDDFLIAVRDLYAGFYEKDDAKFGRGLSALGLNSAEELFRQHFGTGEATAVRFSVRQFQDTFHQTFIRCRDSGTRLHRNFLPLGMYLACLYTQLERLNLELDVNSAYHAAAALMPTPLQTPPDVSPRIHA